MTGVWAVETGVELDDIPPTGRGPARSRSISAMLLDRTGPRARAPAGLRTVGLVSSNVMSSVLTSVGIAFVGDGPVDVGMVEGGGGGASGFPVALTRADCSMAGFMCE